jgi:type IV secretion system protein TrbL
MSNKIGSVSYFRALFLTHFFILASPVAMAAEDVKNDGALGSIVEGIKNLLNSLLSENLIQIFASKASEIAGGLQGSATTLAGVLALISLLWGVLMAYINKKPPVNALIEAVLFGSLAALMIKNFVWVGDGARELAKQVMANGSLSSAGLDYLGKIFGLLGALLMEVWRSLTTWDGILDLFRSGGIITIFALAIAIVFAFIGFVSLIGVALAGPFAFGIGLAISPMVAATIANPYTRRWFDQWLNFMVGAAFLSALVWIALELLGAPLVAIMVEISNQKPSAGSAVQAAILMYFSSKMIQAVPSIADSLFPGRTGAGRIGANAAEIAGVVSSTVTAAATTRIAMANATRATVSGVGQGIKGAMNASSSIKAAMKDAANVGNVIKPEGNIGEKVGAGLGLRGVQDIGAVRNKVNSAMHSAKSQLAKDKASGVGLGDRIANASESLTKEMQAIGKEGAVRAVAGGAKVAAGVLSNTLGKAAGGFSDGAKSGSQHRESMRKTMFGGKQNGE